MGVTMSAPSSGLLLAAWHDYRLVLSEAVPQHDARGEEIERIARCSFYAGAASVMHGIMAQLGTGGTDPTPADEALLDGILRELAEYAAGVRESQA